MNFNVMQLAQEGPKTAAPALDPARQAQIDAAHKTAISFEEMFIGQLLQNIPSGTNPDGPFGGGQAEGIYQSMMNTEYAKAISKNGGIGLASSLQREIMKLQEV